MNSAVRARGRRLAYMAGLALAIPAAAQAQGVAPGPDTVPLSRIEGVTVTVTRAQTTRESVPRTIEVITRTDIERTPASDLAELLKKQAAVDVIQYPGLLAGIGMRGFRPQFFGINQRTLVLIDGRPAGASNLALLDLRDVQRVEVLKGPASALYGSNAMGGVVNIITRRSTGPVRSHVTLGYGSWDTRQGTLAAGGNLTANVDFDLTLAAFEQGRDYRIGEGNFFRDRLGDSVAVRIFPNDSMALSAERGSGEVRPFTQYGTRSGSVRLGYDLGADWRLDWRAEAVRADRVQNPGDLFYAWGDNRTLKNVARTSSDLAVSGALGRHSLTLRAFTAVEEGENFNRPEVTADNPQ
ncbi:MAG TPA: TonB-dependent receptor plug domain-containing protein, partial [Longimicrobiaceae bacterium]|nr:TonB-dependent receptor plug domain-containing protein [Longimicrobiaceae bacterium]